MFSVNHLRSTFIDFFKKEGHAAVASSPLVPHHDPTLMFTNAGMVPFKNVFTGAESRNYTRAVSSQKCVRAGGKHNDLDNVGYTARHHTFFEMLGNFSFGDYFKEDAIDFAWRFLTEEIALPKERLYVTVYHTDDEAFDHWKKIAGLSDDRIIRISTNDNFWSMGAVGPCGPCSEIFYDHGDHIEGGLPGTPEEDGDRYVEIWNLVFMQYEQQADGSRLNLPKPCIDTGMGLERMAAVLQNVHDNYDIDLFKKLIDASESITRVKSDAKHGASHKVIADHLRSSSFLIADGVLPSNEGRGYVLRRIMRRAMRHVHQLGYKDLLMHQLVDPLIEEMGKAYPELNRGRELIKDVLCQEEERFSRTLSRGIALLESESSSLNAGDELSGEVAFKLYDTYGFPLDLTSDMLRQQSISVDQAGFDAAMAEQKARARAAWAGSGEQATDEVWFDIRNTHGATEFLGYTTDTAQGVIQALLVDGASVENVAKAGTKLQIVANQTPFYAESGGQMGDVGQIKTESGAIIEIKDTKKYLGDLHVHVGVLKEGSITCGESAELSIDVEYNQALRANHSATHLLHSVLRHVLGDHVTQKGSLVAHDRLRFDISQPKGLTKDQLVDIEERVNALIRENTSVSTLHMAPEKAMEDGAMALFGEKYGDEVRVVQMGASENPCASKELCGGTHVHQTGDIGYFKIISESAIAAGVRRIEAMTGVEACRYADSQEKIAKDLALVLKTSPDKVIDRVAQLLEDKKQLEKELAQIKQKQLMDSINPSQAEAVAGYQFLGKVVQDIGGKELRVLAESLRTKLDRGVIVLISVLGEDKVSLVTAVSDDIQDNVSAVSLVNIAAQQVGGKGGGGRPILAQAGGVEAAKADSAIEAVQQAIQAA